MLENIADGRTDLVFPYVEAGSEATSKDQSGVSLIQWCAYYGDTSAVRFLLANGESLDSLGKNYDLNGASFHGHWRLCQFLLESGANANHPHSNAAETPLHVAICRSENRHTHAVVQVLLNHGADPNARTNPNQETGCFMRDARVRGEGPLHRAAAFADEDTIDLLIQYGAILDAKDQYGDTPLSWASWYQRPTAVLRRLCFGDFSIHPERTSMGAYLVGKPH